MAGHVKPYEMIRTLFLDATAERPGIVNGTPTHNVGAAVYLYSGMDVRKAKREAVKALRAYLAAGDYGRVSEVYFSVYPEVRAIRHD